MLKLIDIVQLWKELLRGQSFAEIWIRAREAAMARKLEWLKEEDPYDLRVSTPDRNLAEFIRRYPENDTQRD